MVKDGKPVFGTRTVTVETPSLFDSPGSGAISGESQNSRTAPTAEQPIGQSEAGAANKSNGEVPGEAQLPGLEDEDIGSQSC